MIVPPDQPIITLSYPDRRMIEIDVPSKLLPKFDFLQDKILNDKVPYFFFFIQFYKFKVKIIIKDSLLIIGMHIRSFKMISRRLTRYYDGSRERVFHCAIKFFTMRLINASSKNRIENGFQYTTRSCFAFLH